MSSKSKDELIGEFVYWARAAQAATDRFDARANEALGVNTTDGRCLDIVDNEGGGSMTAGRLAELSGLTTAAITAVVDRLEARGYVRRVRDDEDRRRVLVELTPLLRERAEAIWGPVAEEGARELRRFSIEQLRTMIEVSRIQREVNERHAERVSGLRFD